MNVLVAQTALTFEVYFVVSLSILVLALYLMRDTENKVVNFPVLATLPILFINIVNLKLVNDFLSIQSGSVHLIIQIIYFAVTISFVSFVVIKIMRAFKK